MKTSPLQSLRPSPRAARRRGAATVEMAIATPILFLLVFGLFEITHAYMVQHLLQDAVRQGCRLGIMPWQSNSTVQARIDNLLEQEGISGATTSILVNDVAGDVDVAQAGDDVRVKITLDAANVTLYPGGGYLLGQLSASYSLKHE
ncbi:MAG TPA: TadE/TadG family type IV pilus assembly protein [Planctomycetaceae bacterium]|nr:TadE/TadG family type IV pilus assembly protein [Planctomycetaceae bacterium]